jgi:hypothetical protein
MTKRLENEPHFAIWWDVFSVGDHFDLVDFEALPGEVPQFRSRRRTPRPKPGEKFIRGPIPLRWVELASALPGKALAVGLRIWYVAGCKSTRTVPLNLSRQGLTRNAANRALLVLQHAGLVSVVSRRGRPPLVTLLDVPSE